jgi:uncharacterized Zn-binding protein involved in type VI secretion
MPAAARVTDISTHGGNLIGPGVATVLIGGLPAAVAMDQHVCALPASTHQPTVSPVLVGSTSVLIGGLPALRVGDAAVCGASALLGEPTVSIG